MAPPQIDTPPAPKPQEELIAIVGMGCRLPGANDIRQLWKLLIEGGNSVGRYPGHRFPEADAFFAAAANDPDRAAMPLGGFLNDIDQFDAAAFELSPREAMYLDPQHRILLEVAWTALEDAGQTRQDIRTRRTGVFTGLWASDFENTLYKTGVDLEFYAMTGSGRAGASGRLSFTFGFEGPSLTVDAACSSSLVAVHLACKSLLAGECDMALAGGANAILAAEATGMFTRAGMLARDGHCKFGGAAADGFVRSEGAGMVVLKRLEDALAAGDPIHAVIRGGAVSNDGRGSGALMTPSREGQRQTLHEAWSDAGVRGSQIHFFEAHGTGTSVGDPVEVGAIADALRDDGASETCWIGSIKSNIGHTESAAGVASLIKTVLALKHRLVPQTLLQGIANPAIDWANASLSLSTKPQDLRAISEPLIAGVSSFGIMGTNAHLIVEEYRAETAKPVATSGPKAYLLPVSARSAGALDALLKEYESLRDQEFRDICFTASVRRRHDEYRSAFVCESLDELRAPLTAARHDGEKTAIAKDGKRRIVFIAPGQGSQWAGMARQLFADQPVFRQRLQECDAAVFSETGWSVIDILLGNSTDQSLQEIDIVQPALFAISLSLAALWAFWGIVPDAVVGHSMGEVAAACIAGALSLEDAAAIICRRSRLMKNVRGSGAMLTVELPVKAVQQLLREIGGDVSIGASNSPGATVVSGVSNDIERLEQVLVEREIFCRRIRVDVASHSSQVDPILSDLRETLNELKPRKSRINLFSTVRGEYLSGTELDAAYWVSNLRESVNYSDAIETLSRDGYDVFVELSPHPILTAATEDTLRSSGRDHVVIGSGRRGKPETKEILHSLGLLYRYGCDVAWQSFYPEPARCVSLPDYQFQRERCWPDLEELGVAKIARHPQGRSECPLLGQRIESSLQPDTVLWEMNLDLNVNPYLRDHRVHGSIVLPAAAQLEVVLEAMRAEHPGTGFDLCDVRFESAIQIADTQSRAFQLGLRRGVGGKYHFKISGRTADSGDEWTLHTSGFVEPSETHGILKADTQSTEGWRHVGAARHYRLRTRAGVEYGEAFRSLQELWHRPGESLGRIGQVAQNSVYKYVLHPTMLDGCFQAMQYAELDGHGFMQDDTFLPVSLERLVLHRDLPIAGEVYCRSRLVHANPVTGILCCDLTLEDSQGLIAVTIASIELQRVSASMEQRAGELLFEPAWIPFERSSVPIVAASANKFVLIFCDSTGVGESLATEIGAAGGRAVLVRPGVAFTHTAGYTIDPTHRDDVLRIFTEIASQGAVPTDVVHLWSLDQPNFNNRDIDSLLASQALGAYFVPWLVQAIAECNWITPPRLWLVTKNAATVNDNESTLNVAAAPLWGIGSVIAVEHPELRASIVDLSGLANCEEISSLRKLLYEDADEDRLALREGKTYVSRFVRSAREVSAIQPRPLREEEDYAVKVPSVGTLDNLALHVSERLSPGPNEVAIDVAAAGINFIDVAKTMGIYPGLDPAAPVCTGIECAGTIAAVGASVSAFEIGDKVLAISTAPSQISVLASRVCLRESAVFHKPHTLTVKQAAGFPIAFLTAYYSLVEVARLQAGEWVLVPAGAGGVGLAAIQIAHSIGAHVIATASSPEKQEYLRSIGVEFVLPSRTLSFAEEVLRLTAGLGVDVVLNSLAGDYIAKGFEVLKPFGRFIELGKQDIYQDKQIGLRVFRNNISYHAVDLAAMIDQRPAYVFKLLRSLVERAAAGEIKPLPTTSFSASEPAVPFHYMAQGKHIGKIVVCMERDVSVLPSAETKLFRKDATYLITGGMGGVGSTVAEWMASNGAGCLVLISRREPSAETRDIVSRIEARGARVQHARTDIVDRNALNQMLATVRRDMPPIAGIMHAATVIDDSLVANLSPEQFPYVMGPKVKGTWNLYEGTIEDPLDFMVLFSSIAAVYPQPGHGSYAAANAFMDSFAHYARAQGRNVSSINWGGWDGIGLTREIGTARSISGYGQQGFRPMPGPQALSALKRVLQSDTVQAIATPLDMDEAIEFHDPQRIPSVLRTLLAEAQRLGKQAAALPPVQEKLAQSASHAESLDILRTYLVEELSRVLKLAPERIGKDTLFGSIGLDSLMTLEFVRRMKTGLGIAVPTTSVYNHPTPALLAADIAKRLQLDLPSEATPSTAPETPRVHEMTIGFIAEEMSEDEALLTLMQGAGK